MANSWNVFVSILNLKILLNFNVKDLRFTKTNKTTDYNTKFTLREGLKINVLHFRFSQNFPKIWEITKTSIELNHFKIGMCKLQGDDLWLSSGLWIVRQVAIWSDPRFMSYNSQIELRVTG